MRIPAVLLVPSACALASLAVSTTALADAVGLQNATATFSQSAFADFSVAKVIDGNTVDDLGWAIFGGVGSAQTAVFETQLDVGFTGGSLIEFTLATLHSNPGHNLGHFRLSVTTDDRSTFADGLATGGDVVANWTLLDPATASSGNGQTLTEQADFSILASGLNPSTDTVTVTALTLLTGITGVRLEMFTDASLPANGPGRHSNGNFVLSEMTVAITPAPVPETATTAACVLLAGVVGLQWRRSRA